MRASVVRTEWRECVFELLERFFLNARYIGPADAAAGGDLPLCSGRAVIQAVAQGDDGPLPIGQAGGHAVPYLAAGVPGVQVLQHGVVHGDHVHQGQRAALTPRLQGVRQGDLPLELPLGAKVHQDLVRYPLLTDT